MKSPFCRHIIWFYSSFHSTNSYANLQVIARLCLLLCYGNRFWSIHFFALQACQSFTQRDLKTGGTFVGLQLCLWLACTDNTWVVRRNPCYLRHIELILLTYIGIKHHDKDPHEPTSKMGCHQGFVTVVQMAVVCSQVEAQKADSIWNFCWFPQSLGLGTPKPTTHSSSSRFFFGAGVNTFNTLSPGNQHILPWERRKIMDSKAPAGRRY